MSKRRSESARILEFFHVEDLGKAEVLYDLVRDTMVKRLAPTKAARKAASAAKRKVKANAEPATPIAS